MSPEYFNPLIRKLIPSLNKSQNKTASDWDNTRFAMRSNGYDMRDNGQWRFNPGAISHFVKEFSGQKVSFFGPGSDDKFFSADKLDHSQYLRSFHQHPMVEAMRKYRAVDEDQAARIAFLSGGMVRHLSSQSYHRKPITDEIINSVSFAARMTMLGDGKSADAITSAMAMYVISDGPLVEDRHFIGNVYKMAEAVSEDPITPEETADLGLSQVARLHSFRNKINSVKYESFPDISNCLEAFKGFPTVGGEFHFHPNAPDEYPNFWQRLAILNMSQYQRGSYVQFSRNDRGVIEVRMNPSIYPIAVANWQYIRLLLPELNQTFFTATINRTGTDFSWNRENSVLLNNLRALGLLSYSGLFKNNPRLGKSEEIDFGKVYLGQTVRMQGGKYDFTGNWGGGEGRNGQLGIYAGYGDNFPQLAYYSSMVLANPDILGSVSKIILERISNLNDAFQASSPERRYIFQTVQNSIETDTRLSKAFKAGNKIFELLSP